MTAPNDASRAQIAAARPDRSTWVAANAGSGKTRVLTDRVARLLLAGTDPQSILCLTYTKAAAAEMQTRLFDRLGGWAMLDNDALRTSLRDLGETGALSGEALDQARTLFARALETPGGLKIQTIHAFCASLLRRFPLEAGVSPSFRELDERDMVELRAEVLDAMALEEPHLFDPIADETAGADPEELIEAILGTRAAFAAPFDEAALNAALRVSADEDWPAVLAEALPEGHEALLEALLEPLRGSGKTDSASAERIAVALSLEPRARLVHPYRKAAHPQRAPAA
ncbi:MAG: UvrD-helicase domain-containing protein, partial [Pseudomonadota bacterium]